MLAVLAGASVAQRASADCRIWVEHASLRDLVVATPGASFMLSVDRVPLAIRPRAASANARLEIRAPLRFGAEYPLNKLAFRIKDPVDLHGGRVRLGQGAAPEWLGPKGSAMQVSVESMLGIRVSQTLEVPCSHLGLGDGQPYATPARVIPPKESTVGTGADFFPLHLKPEPVDPLKVQYSGAFRVIERRRGWLLLEAAWADGSRLHGWTPDHHAKPDFESLAGWGEGITGGPLCGKSHGPVYVRFRLREETPISASPGGPIWAWAAKSLAVDAFPLDRSDGWIRLGAVPGLIAAPNACDELEHLWVHARDIIWSSVPAAGRR